MLIERFIKLFKKIKNTSLARDSFWALATRGISAGLMLALSILLARWAGDKAFGDYSVAWAWAETVGLFLGLGIPALQLRFFVTYFSKREYGNLKGLIIWSTKTILGISILVSAVGQLVINTDLVNVTIEQQRLWSFTAILVVLIPLLKLLEEMLRSSRRILASQAPLLVLRPTLVLLVSGAVYYLAAWPLTGSTILAILVLSSIVVLAFYLFYLHDDLSAKIKAVQPIYQIKKWRRVSFPLLLNLSFGLLLNRLDILMIGAMVSTTAGGFYFAGVRIANISGKLLDAFLTGFTPRIAPLWEAGKIDELQSMITKALPIIFWPSAVLTGVIIWFSDAILAIWGDAFVSMSLGLQILIVCKLLDASTGPVNRLMDMTGHHDKSAQMYGTSAVLNAIFNVIGIYYWGITGAAIATGTVILLRNVWAVWWVYANLGIKSCIIFSPFGR